MRPKVDAQTVMLAHSRAKVELYKTYLPIYLNILGKVSSVTKIYLFDLLCGEGIYQDGSKGSPIVALEAIKDYYYSHNQTCPDMEVLLNDKGSSQIEKGIFKIDRVRNYCSRIAIPQNVQVTYCQKDFEAVYADALHRIRNDKNAKGLFFIDPYGYKIIRPDHIREILSGRNAEVILFLPASNMYRFAEKSLQEPFPGSEALREFLNTLFQGVNPAFSSVRDFIQQIKVKLRSKLSDLDIYVDTFTLQRDYQNTYCLFFFTSSLLGFHKMLEAKWKLDTDQGQGFTLDRTLPLWDELHVSDYPEKVLNFIRSAPFRTNKELYTFGLQEGYLPKHTNRVLSDQKKSHHIEVFSLDGESVRGNYIEYKSLRQVGFRVHQDTPLF